mmetsp:Transcript_20181/g.32242  ORF Transcript_20181/g.32242 Transcript_20181/m.32242 type:complete len:267 (+) Transcript_20181:594-1394(+)
MCACFIRRCLGRQILARSVPKPARRLSIKRNLAIVVQILGFAFAPLLQMNARRFQFAPLLQRRQSPRLFQLFLARLALRFLAFGVGQTSARLRQHLLLVLVHVDGVGTRWLRLWMRVNLAWSQTPQMPATQLLLRRALDEQFLLGVVLISLSLLLCAHHRVQQMLVALEALCGGPTYDGRDAPPLTRHDLGEMQQFLVLGLTPLRLLDARVQPFVPTRFALLGRLAHQQRRDARPLIQTVLHHGCFQDLVLGVLPHTAFDHDPHVG